MRLGYEDRVTLQPRSANQPPQKRTWNKKKKKKMCRVHTQRPSAGKSDMCERVCVKKSGLRSKSLLSNKWYLVTPSSIHLLNKSDIREMHFFIHKRCKVLQNSLNKVISHIINAEDNTRIEGSPERVKVL